MSEWQEIRYIAQTNLVNYSVKEIKFSLGQNKKAFNFFRR
jgi:hypothetical protein